MRHNTQEPQNSTAESRVKRVIALLEALREALDTLEPDEERVFGDGLRIALDHAKARRGFYPQYYPDVKPKLSARDENIANARRNLEHQRAMLADLKRRSHRTFSLKRGPEGEKISQDAIDAAQERVNIAEEQLAQAEGRLSDHEEQLRAEAEAARKAEAMEAAQGIAAFQARMKAKFSGTQGQ